MSEPARLLIADDHTLVREGLRLILASEPAFEVVADVDDGLAAVRYAVEHPVDLAILDITMPGLTGLQAARQILDAGVGTRVLILTMHNSEQYLFEALRLGASRVLPKYSPGSDRVTAGPAAPAPPGFL